LKDKFKFENPQIKIGEVEDMFLSAAIVAKKIANDLSNFGSQKFKLTGFRSMSNILNAGASGVEIRITGKLPSSRAKSWRFAKGYIKKTGYVSDFLVDKAIEKVTLKTGVVGIKVSIMLPDTPLPDKIDYLEAVVPSEIIEKIEEEKLEETSNERVDDSNNDSKTEKKVDLKEETKSTSKKSSKSKDDESSLKKQKTNKEQSTKKDLEEEKTE
jgi:ribosomal protein S3